METRYQVGQVAVERRVFTQEDFHRFAALSGDDNPIHIDPSFAAQTRFGKTVAHGMLLYGGICGALARHFPALVQLEQDLMFPNPTYAGEAITVRLEVVDLQPGQHRARIDVLVSKSDGEPVVQGQMLVGWAGERRGG